MAFVGAGAPVGLALAVVMGAGRPSIKPSLRCLMGCEAQLDSGRNLIIEYRFSQPPDRLPASVADLIASQSRCAHRPGTAGSGSPESATATIPIVFEAVGDPVGLGLVQSYRDQVAHNGLADHRT